MQNKNNSMKKKTDALLTDSQNSPNLQNKIRISQNLIHLSRSVQNLGEIFDDKLSMKQQVSKHVSLPTWNCIELAQFKDKSSELKLPKSVRNP